jgi:hypothetical protein
MYGGNELIYKMLIGKPGLRLGIGKPDGRITLRVILRKLAIKILTGYQLARMRSTVELFWTR